MMKPSSHIEDILEEQEQAQNQEVDIHCSESLSDSSISPPHSNKRAFERTRFNEDNEDSWPNSSGVPISMAPWRTGGSKGFSMAESEQRTGKAPNPNFSFPRDDDDEDGGDEGDHDLAWFFKILHPDVDKYTQIAWCRTYANWLAAQMPKNRPKKYLKTKKENI